jgi:predicted enzyme related to lactoylglutathione lyase
VTATVQHIVFDCTDAYALARFWMTVTGGHMADDDLPGDEVCGVRLPTGQELLFVRVPEAKAGKNRVHIDITPNGLTRDEEIGRLLVAGARMVTDRRKPNGLGWAVMADPEGNEFCVESAEAELEHDRDDEEDGQ